MLHLISIYNCVYTAQCRSRWCPCFVQENHCPVWIDIPSSSAVFRRRRTRACEQFLPKRSREGGQDRPRSRAGQWLGSMRTSAFFRRHAGPEKEETASDETSVTHAANCRGSGSVDGILRAGCRWREQWQEVRIARRRRTEVIHLVSSAPCGKSTALRLRRRVAGTKKALPFSHESRVRECEPGAERFD